MDKVEKCIYYNDLYDLYGNLLTEREKEIFVLFYEEDLSLQEIADAKKVSKSAIGKAIQTITNKLETYEEKLHFLAKIVKVNQELKTINNCNIEEKINAILKD